MSSEKENEPKKNWRRTFQHIIAGVIFYLAFSYSLFLGLQVEPLYGNIGIVATMVALVIYIRFFK